MKSRKKKEQHLRNSKSLVTAGRHTDTARCSQFGFVVEDGTHAAKVARCRILPSLRLEHLGSGAANGVTDKLAAGVNGVVLGRGVVCDGMGDRILLAEDNVIHLAGGNHGRHRLVLCKGNGRSMNIICQGKG